MCVLPTLHPCFVMVPREVQTGGGGDKPEPRGMGTCQKREDCVRRALGGPIGGFEFRPRSSVRSWEEGGGLLPLPESEKETVEQDQR